MMARDALRLIVPGVLLLAMGTMPLHAQVGGEEGDVPEALTGEEEPPGERPANLELAPKISVLAPLGTLTSDPGFFGTEVTTSVAFGGSGTWWPDGGSLGVTLQGMWAPAELDVRPTEFTGPIPTELGDANYSSVTVGVIYRLRTSGATSVVEPFFTAGVGFRRFTFDAIASEDVRDSTDPVGTVAAGVHTPISDALGFRVEFRDNISTFRGVAVEESKLQNDLVVSVGIVFRR